MEKENRLYDDLKMAVETVAQREMLTPRDFDYLANRITERTNIALSPTTLKRFWGYLDKRQPHTPRLYTLNALAKYVGYDNYASFERITDTGDSESRFINSPSLCTSSLEEGDKVSLTWSPNRRVLIHYLGQDRWRVEESINSKLMTGDEFDCRDIMSDYPLYLTNLTRNGLPPQTYACGLNGGVRFTIIHKSGGG